MASDRARELERMYQMRRGHAPQISISDDNHHVTEAIGDLYGGDSDSESTKRTSRPLSFIPSPNGDSIQSFGAFEPFDPFPTAPPAKSPLRSQMPAASSSANLSANPPSAQTTLNGTSNMSTPQKRNSLSSHGSQGPLSPPLSRTNSDTASQQFPLNDLDYESSPAGLAQELSNLQAIRRMSMGVNNADPDLPSFKSNNGPPSPPALSDDEDPSKLFWVPARLHPELAPKEFKTFIEEKVNTIRRRSGDSDSLSPDSAMGRQGSGGGLRRKKSMLSRQIDNGSEYKDGAERLERKRSGHQPNSGLANLHELEHIVEDPIELVRHMSLSQHTPGLDSEAGAEGKTSMGPGKFGGMGTLKRSTHTTYRRGSLRKGGPPLSRRLLSRQGDTDTEDSPSTSPVYTSEPEVPPLPITRVQSEPVNGQFEGPSNFSRPRRRSPPTDTRPGSAEDSSRPASAGPVQEEQNRPKPKAFHSRIASNGRTSAHLPGYKPPTLPPVSHQVPQIIETPPPQEPERRQPYQLPERHSSRQPPPQLQQQQQQQQQQSPNGPRNHTQHQPNQQQRQPQARQNRHAQAAQASPIKPAQSFDELVHNPALLPGNSTRTDSLSIIPNLPEEKKSDKKSKDKKEDGSRKTSWGWLTGGDKEKEREKKEKEEREKEMAKKVKNKLSKNQDKAHDDTRLDVLQTSMQASGGRGRESVVLDRESLKLEEERKKESHRKTSSDGRKEKEPGLLSSIFGGGKKKSEKESSHKKNASRGLSPEPPPRILKPDIDYNWTRFSILEERAIYRMAHIKLANPRRELYSQVLLSNFMYSYLAKVQQMHPQIQIGNSKQAKQAQEAQQRQQQVAQQKKEQQQQTQAQPEEFAQYQRYQQQQQQDQSEKTNEWPSVHQQQQNIANGRPPSQENGHQMQRDQSPNAYNQNPRDSHHSQHSANGGSGAGGGGYSVANTQNYLGQPTKKGYHHYSDSDQSSSRAENDDMW